MGNPAGFDGRAVLSLRKIVLLGGGGHAAVVIDAIRAGRLFDIVGILDLEERIREDVEGIRVVGSDDDLASWRTRGVECAFVAKGSVGDPRVRIHLAGLASRAGFELPAIVHPAASVASSATIRDGAFIAAGAVVGPGTMLGEFCIVNSAAVVDHHCVIGAFVHVAPGVALSGGVRVGDRTHVGTGTAVSHGISIGADSIIGVGSVVVRDVPGAVVAHGVPCRPVKSWKDAE